MGSESMNQDDIKQLIPHRDPFLWIDEVVSIEDSRIHARARTSLFSARRSSPVASPAAFANQSTDSLGLPRSY